MLSAIILMKELSCIELYRIESVSVKKLIYFYGDIFISQMMVFLSCCTSVSPDLNYSQYVPDLSSALMRGESTGKQRIKQAIQKRDINNMNQVIRYGVKLYCDF